MLRGECLEERFDQRREVACHHFPEHVIVHVHVVVQDAMTDAHNLLPGNLRMPGSTLVRDPARSLTDGVNEVCEDDGEVLVAIVFRAACARRELDEDNLSVLSLKLFDPLVTKLQFLAHPYRQPFEGNPFQFAVAVDSPLILPVFHLPEIGIVVDVVPSGYLVSHMAKAVSTISSRGRFRPREVMLSVVNPD